MNYGKTAYLKIIDIEKELNLNLQTDNNLKFYENSKMNINQNISYNQQFTLPLDNILVQKSKSVLFQVKISLSSTLLSSVSFDILINKNVIHNEIKTISSNTDIILLKTYIPLETQSLNVLVNIKNLTQNSFVAIDNITTVIIGAEGESVSQNLELRALKYPNENRVLLSYIDNNELFYIKTSLTEKSLHNDDFSFLMPAISHCFCLKKYSENFSEQNDIILYRVDTNKKLYYSKFLENIEFLIDDNVDIVHAHACPIVSDEFNIVAYIKGGVCYYRTMRENTLSSAKLLPLPNGQYKDIRVVSKSDSEYVYIVATHENGSNYILHSLIEASTGNINEFIKASYSVTVSKYIDLSFINSISTETIKASITLNVSKNSYFDELINQLTKEKISVHCDYNIETYKNTIVEDITYGVKLDKSILIGTDWATYTDDAVGFNGAYMDFDNDVFIDNGWTQRWPFNQIKPCILKEGKVIGYLNPNNFAEFIDGTMPDTTSVDSGYIMIEIPKMYFSITRDEDYINVKISNTPKEGFVCTPFVYKGVELNKLYISAYLCGHQSFELYGFKMPNESYVSTSVTLGYNANRYNILKNLDGERFEFMPYNVLKLIQCLYIIMFKHTNSQVCLGAGYSAERTSHKVGMLNDKGMYYGKNSSHGVKFIGLEDIYGARKQLVTGFYIEAASDGSFKPRFIDPYDKNMSYDPALISTYLTSDLPFTKGSKYLRSVIDINQDAINIGFFGSSNSTDKTLGFCDSSSMTTSASSFVDFGWSGTGLANGMFAQITTVSNDASPKRSARLVYYPES